MKIITFTKNNQFQALLQFSDPVNAQQAKLVGSHTWKFNNQQKIKQQQSDRSLVLLLAFANYSFHEALAVRHWLRLRDICLVSLSC